MQEAGPPARQPLCWSRGPGTAGVLKRGCAWRGLGGSAPSEVPTGLPVSTPALGQQGLAPPAEPSTGPGSCSKTEAGCRALGVLPELSFISWISGRLLGQWASPPRACPLCSPRRPFRCHGSPIHHRLELLRVSGYQNGGLLAERPRSLPGQQGDDAQRPGSQSGAPGQAGGCLGKTGSGHGHAQALARLSVSRAPWPL